MSNYDEPHFNYNREIIITQPNKNKPAHIVNIRESSIETMYYRKHIDAIQDLNRLHSVIGQNHYELLEYVCGFGNTIKQMNSKFKLSKRRGGPKFREALDEASIFYGLRDKGNTIRGNKKR